MQTYVIKAPIAKVWQALVNPKVIEKWGGDPVVMDDQVGTELKLWGGEIYGKNLKVIPEKLLVREWFDENFVDPSEVRFELSENHGHTTVKLVHSKVPDDRVEDISEGWKVYYLGPLQQLFETK